MIKQVRIKLHLFKAFKPLSLENTFVDSVERASVPRVGPRAEQVEEGTAVVRERGSIQQQPRHNSKMVKNLFSLLIVIMMVLSVLLLFCSFSHASSSC